MKEKYTISNEKDTTNKEEQTKPKVKIIFKSLLQPGSLPYPKNERNLSGRPDTLTNNERKKLNEFYKMLNPLDIEQIKMPSESWETCLLRILRADDFNLTTCKKRWETIVQWRKKYQIYENRNRKVTSIVFGNKIQLQDLLNLYPYGVKGTDRSGRPIVYKNLGELKYDIFSNKNLNTSSSSSNNNIDNLCLWEAINACRLVNDILPHCSSVRKEHIENYVGIIDLNGLGMFSFDSNMRAMILGGIKLCGELFPETLGTMFIINTPFVFSTIWA